MKSFYEIVQPLLSPIGALGIVGQSMYFFRFLIQWITSERRQESVVPVAFWYFSIAGAIMVIIYWIGTPNKEPLLIVGQVFGLVAYTRNLMLVRKSRLRSISKGGE